MCGRYAASANPDELVEEFEVEEDHTGGQAVADYNVAPTKAAPVVVNRVPRELKDTDGAAPVRQLRLLTWGLVPSWAKDRKGGARMINARVESVFDKPAFRRAMGTRRALVPADGWFEWRKLGGGSRPVKQPCYLTRDDGDRCALAGIYEFWRDPALEPDHPDAWLTTFAVLTTAAEPQLRDVHDRMPVVLDPDTWAAWLDPASDPEQVRALLTELPQGRFQVSEVSTLVNDVSNNGPELLAPAAVNLETGELF